MEINVEKDLKEWEELLEAMNYDIVRRSLLKDEYEEKAQEIINETDFKELYGANNQKVRDNHVKKMLSSEASELKILDLSIHQDKRRIDLLKQRIQYGIVLMEANK